MMKTDAPIPSQPQDVTLEWLTGALGSTAPMTSVTLEPIAKGRGFVGSLFRCRLEYARPGSGPDSAIVKMPAADSRRRELFTRFALYEREVRFYRCLQAQTPVPTPRCYHASFDDATGNFVLLLDRNI